VKGNSSTITASLNAATYDKVMTAGFPCSVSIDLPEGNYWLRLGVQDRRSGLIGTTNARVLVPRTTAAVYLERKTEDKKL
jgi:hypothetical protein